MTATRPTGATLAVALVLLAAAAAVGGGCARAPTAREHALILLARGRTQQAIAELERLRDGSPSNPQAWVDLGHGYELAQRYDDALEAYDRAAAVAPDKPIGPREGGVRSAAWGESKAALPRLEEAISRGDDEPATFHALGLVRLALGDRPGARRAYEAGLATPRGAKDATCVLGLATLAVVEDDAKEALRWYDELVKRRPQAPGGHLGRAWALTRLRRHTEADAAITEGASLGAKPEDVARLRRWTAEERKR